LPREAYLAVFHSDEAYIFEPTGKVAKTDRDVRSEFTRLSKAEPRIGATLLPFSLPLISSRHGPITPSAPLPRRLRLRKRPLPLQQLLPPGLTPPPRPRAEVNCNWCLCLRDQIRFHTELM
jgi:hypothetical protein